MWMAGRHGCIRRGAVNHEALTSAGIVMVGRSVPLTCVLVRLSAIGVGLGACEPIVPQNRTMAYTMRSDSR